MLAAVSAVTAAAAAEFRQTSQSHAGSQLEPEPEASQSQPRLQQHLQPHEEHPQPQQLLELLQHIVHPSIDGWIGDRIPRSTGYLMRPVARMRPEPPGPSRIR